MTMTSPSKPKQKHKQKQQGKGLDKAGLGLLHWAPDRLDQG
jgi:hypothetical protein